MVVKRSLDALYEGFYPKLSWNGKPLWKNPVDLVIYQMIAKEIVPTLVIETGTHLGGSAEFWSDMMRCEGRVVTIDTDQRCDWNGSQITALEGSSTDPAVVATVAQHVRRSDRVLVSLDSWHASTHVLDELDAYHGFVTTGSYIIVEDGIDDMRYRGRLGPRAACREWIEGRNDFEIDKKKGIKGFTNCPDGFLRRIR